MLNELDSFITNIKAFFPHANATIDEQLFPCRSQCPFIQYMSQKPAKFGINFYMICDVDTYYVLQLMNSYFDTGLNVTTDNFYKPFYSQEAQKTQNNYGWHCAPSKRDSRRNKIRQKNCTHLYFYFVSMKIKTTHNLQFSMPFAAEMDIKSSGSIYERH